MNTNSTHKTEVVYRSLDFLGFSKYRIGRDGSVWRRWKNKWKQIVVVEIDRGYRRFMVWKNAKSKMFFLHRVLLLAFVGPCPDGCEACHNDGNPSNNNISNLRWGTKKENGEDKVKHGRSLKGTKNHTAKLTEKQVLEIRSYYATGEYSLNGLAEFYKVSKHTILHIVHRKIWRHI